MGSTGLLLDTRLVPAGFGYVGNSNIDLVVHQNFSAPRPAMVRRRWCTRCAAKSTSDISPGNRPRPLGERSGGGTIDFTDV
jgi:hypothetical protein